MCIRDSIGRLRQRLGKTVLILDLVLGLRRADGAKHRRFLGARVGDSLLFAASIRCVDVGDTGIRRCRRSGANLSCEQDSRLAMSAWIGARELVPVNWCS